MTHACPFRENFATSVQDGAEHGCALRSKISPHPINAAGTDSTHAPARSPPQREKIANDASVKSIRPEYLKRSASGTTRSRQTPHSMATSTRPHFRGRQKRLQRAFRRDGNRKITEKRNLLRDRNENGRTGGGVLQTPGVRQTVSRTNELTNHQSSVINRRPFSPESNEGREIEKRIRRKSEITVAGMKRTKGNRPEPSPRLAGPA